MSVNFNGNYATVFDYECLLPAVMFYTLNYRIWNTLQERVYKIFGSYGPSTLVAENGDFVSGNRQFCVRFRRLLPETAILSPETGDFVAESRRFWQQSRLFPETKSPFSATSVDRPLDNFE